MVDNLLKQKVSCYKLLDIIYDIFMYGWSWVMFLVFFWDDVEYCWNELVWVVDDLIWCLYFYQDDEEWDQWVCVVLSLLKIFRVGFEEVFYNFFKLDEMMGYLKYELVEVFCINVVIEVCQDLLVDLEEEIVILYQIVVECQ